MEKPEEYQHLAKSIKNIYKFNHVILDKQDEEWIELIFEITCLLDTMIDVGKDNGLPGKILEILKGAEAIKQLEKVTLIRETLLGLENGEQRLRIFIRKLSILFRATSRIQKETKPSEYLRYSILEGRMFGEMVALGVKDQSLRKLVGRAGGMENLTDDLLDIKNDTSSGERQLTPTTGFYIQGLTTTVAQILNLHRQFGTNKSLQAIRAAFPTMWKKYVMETLYKK